MTAAMNNEVGVVPFIEGGLDIDQVVQAIRATPDGNKTFFDTEALDWVRELQSHTAAIRTELARLMRAGDLLPGIEEIQEQYTLSQDGRWQMLPLYAYGHWVDSNVRRCPNTASAVARIPGVLMAMFSVLQAHKEIPPHVGNYCGVLRYHLGLIVPQPETSCALNVGPDVRSWREGESLLFDDTHTHAAWNRSNECRVVLMIDVERPLPPVPAALNARVIAAIASSRSIADAVKRWQAWESVHGARFDRLIQGAEERA